MTDILPSIFGFHFLRIVIMSDTGNILFSHNIKVTVSCRVSGSEDTVD